MPSCSRLSRSGLEALRQTAPLAWRPSLTAARHDGVGNVQAGTERCSRPNQKITPKRRTECGQIRYPDPKTSPVHETGASPYKGAGWVSWGDWLGTGRVYRGNCRPFKNARAFVRKLGLSSWDDYRSSGRRPADIPAHPDRIYADAGWAGMADWLGTDRLTARRWQESDAHTVV
jgi:hypothetical protein